MVKLFKKTRSKLFHVNYQHVHVLESKFGNIFFLNFYFFLFKLTEHFNLTPRSLSTRNISIPTLFESRLPKSSSTNRKFSTLTKAARFSSSIYRHPSSSNATSPKLKAGCRARWRTSRRRPRSTSPDRWVRRSGSCRNTPSLKMKFGNTKSPLMALSRKDRFETI